MRNEQDRHIEAEVNGERIFVGRQKELQVLQELAIATRDTPALLYLSGAPGIGKTALMEEFVRQNSENAAVNVRYYKFGEEEVNTRIADFINFVCEKTLNRNQIVGLTDRDRSEQSFKNIISPKDTSDQAQNVILIDNWDLVSEHERSKIEIALNHITGHLGKDKQGTLFVVASNTTPVTPLENFRKAQRQTRDQYGKIELQAFNDLEIRQYCEQSAVNTQVFLEHAAITYGYPPALEILEKKLKRGEAPDISEEIRDYICEKTGIEKDSPEELFYRMISHIGIYQTGEISDQLYGSVVETNRKYYIRHLMQWPDSTHEDPPGWEAKYAAHKDELVRLFPNVTKRSLFGNHEWQKLFTTRIHSEVVNKEVFQIMPPLGNFFRDMEINQSMKEYLRNSTRGHYYYLVRDYEGIEINDERLSGFINRIIPEYLSQETDNRKMRWSDFIYVLASIINPERNPCFGHKEALYELYKAISGSERLKNCLLRENMESAMSPMLKTIQESIDNL
jgi:ATPase family associated with various cellular activities (AAA)